MLLPPVAGTIVISFVEVKFPAVDSKLMVFALILMGKLPASTCDPSNTLSAPLSGTLIVICSAIVMFAALLELPDSPKLTLPFVTSSVPFLRVISPRKSVSLVPPSVFSVWPLKVIDSLSRISAPVVLRPPLVVSIVVSLFRLMLCSVIPAPSDAIVPATNVADALSTTIPSSTTRSVVSLWPRVTSPELSNVTCWNFIGDPMSDAL